MCIHTVFLKNNKFKKSNVVYLGNNKNNICTIGRFGIIRLWTLTVQ